MRYLPVFFLLTSCATSPIQRPWEMTSMAAMPFEVETIDHVALAATGTKSFIWVPFEGVGAATRLSSTRIRFKPRYEPAEFMLLSCAREKFLGAVGRDFTYRYVPMSFLENVDACPVIAVSISKQGQRETAVLDFVTGDQLPASIKCNGETRDAQGADICQLRAGLAMMVWFREPVDVEPAEGCEPPKEDGFMHEIVVPRGHCTYTFLGIKSRQFFRLTTRGYDSVLETAK